MAGRPLSVFDLVGEWYNDILEMYREGASDVEVKAYICEQRGSFSNDLWDRWLKDEEEFSETIKIGKMLSEAWWVKQGRIHLKVPVFNYTGWYINMKNRFKWTDKQEHGFTDKEGNDVSPATILFTNGSKPNGD